MRTPALAWARAAGRSRILGFVDAMLRGAGQVMFQESPLSGLLFLAAIGHEALVTRSWRVALGGLVGLVAATAVAELARRGEDDRAALKKGLYGYNGLLVGLALASFFAPGGATWALLVLGAAATTYATRAAGTVLGGVKLPAMTAPFVAVAWIFLASSFVFGRAGLVGLSAPTLPSGGLTGALAWPEPLAFVRTTARGLAEVFLLGDTVTGAILFLGLAAGSLRAALLGTVASSLGAVLALLLGADPHAIELGLFGFNPALTAIALGSVFAQPGARATVIALAGAALTVVVQAAVTTMVTPLGIPALTAPFVLTTWLCLAAGAPHEPAADAQATSDRSS